MLIMTLLIPYLIVLFGVVGSIMTAFPLIEVSCFQTIGLEKSQKWPLKALASCPGEFLTFGVAYSAHIKMAFWHVVNRASQDGCQPTPKYQLLPLGAPEETWRIQSWAVGPGAHLPSPQLWPLSRTYPLSGEG